MRKALGPRRDWIGFTDKGRVWKVNARSLHQAVEFFKRTLEPGEEALGVFLEGAMIQPPQPDKEAVHVAFVVYPKPRTES